MNPFLIPLAKPVALTAAAGVLVGIGYVGRIFHVHIQKKMNAAAKKLIDTAAQ